VAAAVSWPPAAARADVQFTGVNLAGAEFQTSKIPGIFGRDYIYPEPAEVLYFLKKGMNTIRLPFRWERLQARLYDDFDAAEIRRIDNVVRLVTSQGARIVLDLHNYGRYRRKTVGSPETPIAAFAAFWTQLSQRYKSNDRVIFGLMNEPHGIPATAWQEASTAAIKAIRDTGATNLILVPGTAWTGAHSWMQRKEGASNAEAMIAVTDPLNNFAYEVHQYFDWDYTGTRPECGSEHIGVTTLKPFTEWARQHRRRAFLGEFGAAPNATCLAALENMLEYMQANSDVWLGWTYWAAGSWWKNYPFSVHPEAGIDKPQMPILLRFSRQKSAG
jgi:endoglucanase